MAYEGITPRRALIIGPAWVGDMVMAHTLVRLLAPGFAELHMAAPPATLSLAERMPEITHTHALDFAHGDWKLLARRRVGKHLRQQNLDAAYVLPNSWKSALIPWFANIPSRIGWLGESRYGLLNQRPGYQADVLPLMIERFMALAHPHGELPSQPYPLPALQSSQTNLAQLQTRHALVTDWPVVVLCPGAEFGPAKQWPAAHFAALARDMLAQNKSVWLLGAPRDVDVCNQILAAAPGVVSLAGQTSLVDALDLLSAASFVVSNDSGLMHLAAAAGARVLGIFGSTSPDFTPPLGPTAQVVQRDMSCRPCFQRTCPLGHTACLHELAPEQVLEIMP